MTFQDWVNIFHFVWPGVTFAWSYYAGWKSAKKR
jgi:hypothetical protein